MNVLGGLGLFVCGFVLLAVIVLGAALVVLYNRLVTLRNRTQNAWSQIDVQLKRRYDLIPNLVETVKGYAGHERETLEKVVQARQLALDAKSVAEQSQAENVLTSTLRSLFAVAEAYPDLKANQNFLRLQDELSGIEQAIAYSRQFYNDSVMTFNTAIQSFPANTLAGPMGFTAREYFEVEVEAREAPQVSFQ